MKILKKLGLGCLGLVVLVFVAFCVLVVKGLISTTVPAVGDNDKGLAAMNNGDLPTALADFNQAIQIQPTVGKFYTNRATVEIKMGDNTDALADCNKAIQLEPNLEQPYENRGVLEGQSAAAMADFNKAIQLNPKDDNAYASRGALKYEQGDAQGALADINQALAINPKNSTATQSLAIVSKAAQSGAPASASPPAPASTPSTAQLENMVGEAGSYLFTSPTVWERDALGSLFPPYTMMRSPGGGPLSATLEFASDPNNTDPLNTYAQARIAALGATNDPLSKWAVTAVKIQAQGPITSQFGATGIRVLVSDMNTSQAEMQVFYYFSYSQGKVIVCGTCNANQQAQYLPVFDAAMNTMKTY